MFFKIAFIPLLDAISFLVSLKKHYLLHLCINVTVIDVHAFSLLLLVGGLVVHREF